MGKDDSLVLRRIMESVKSGGRVVLTAFSALHEARYPRAEAAFDVDAGIVHETTTVKDEAEDDHVVDLWTGVYTPRELRLLAVGVGLVPEHVWSVAPGDFAKRTPGFEHPELMMVARKP